MPAGMPVSRAAAASEAHVAKATLDALRRGNAADAVVTGVLVAAASSPSVLLGPVQILAAGAGTGLVAIDGRVRQPGRGAARPRGFLPKDPIPDAAYVGVPVLPAALAAALGSLGTVTLPRAAAPAIGWARTSAQQRVAVLEAVAKKGGLGLALDAIAVELTAVAGRAVGGLLTRGDLTVSRPEIVRCTERSLGPPGIFRVPWSMEDAPDASQVHVVAACDTRGRVVVACYEAAVDAVHVPALGLSAPRCAVPVMRGKRRVAPGTPLPAAAPIALRVRRGRTELAVGVALGARAQDSMTAVLESLARSILPAEALLLAAPGRAVFLTGHPG
jgi:gamma-glutamyltranspeptidase/glutathione hydrolase